MSDLLDHRDAFYALVNDAHGTPNQPAAQMTTLPAGHFWTPHQPKAGPLPPRKRRPASEFCDLLAQ